MKYIIHQVPVEWKRAGVNFNTKIFYDRQLELKELYAYALRLQHKDAELFNSPVHLDVTFYMPTVKDKKRRQAMMDQHYHTNTPDLSNLIKFLEDSAVGVIFEDDRVIAKITAQKVYDDNPRTEFSVEYLLAIQKS